jgi:hypothetical protein
MVTIIEIYSVKPAQVKRTNVRERRAELVRLARLEGPRDLDLADPRAAAREVLPA